MFIDSHCHLNFPELRANLPQILSEMAAAQVEQAICICTTMEEFDGVRSLAAEHDHLWATVGGFLTEIGQRPRRMGAWV